MCVVQGLTESVSRAKTLRSLLAQYDQHGNYRRYVTDLVAALGYTQKNGFATKTLVAPNGNEFDIPPEIARNRDEPAQTMHLLAMRLRSGSRHRSTREFEDFLGNDGSWFMVERRL